METFFYKILPQKEASSYPTYEEWKLSLYPKTKNTYKGSYPTYEEWKPLNSILSIFSYLRSYPTYEEWKLTLIVTVVLQMLKRSYPTYEEWKHIYFWRLPYKLD